MNPTDRRVLDALLRENFPAFVEKCFATVCPGDVYLHNWHIHHVGYELARPHVAK